MVLVSLHDYEEAAYKNIPGKFLDYYRSGAGDELSLKLNRSAFDRILIRPRVLRDVTVCDTSCSVFGINLTMPIAISPTAMQKMAHHEGEVGNARAAGKQGIIFTLSTISTTSIEDVQQGAPDTNKWFQLYIYKDRELTKKMVLRAEKAGFKALVLTVDAPVFGLRRPDIKNKFSLPTNLTLANFVGEQAAGVRSTVGSGINEYVTSQFDKALTWADVKWLKSFSKLPLIVKGILRADDAVLAVDHGVDGIMVSNHGARQIDSTPSTSKKYSVALRRDIALLCENPDMDLNSLITVDDFEKYAFEALPEKYIKYYKSGSGDELTLKLNRTAYDHFRILPHVLRDVSSIDTSCKILGLDLSMPIAVAPTAMQKIAHSDGETANARAAGTAKTIFTLSLIATSSIEEVADAAPDTIKWLQIYIYEDREITKRFVQRAETAGFKALVLTVDTPITGYKRPYHRDQGPLLPRHLRISNFIEFEPPGCSKEEHARMVQSTNVDKTLTWKDVEWMKSITTLPVIVKGILRADDAVLAVEHGVDGIIVSNHGARQLDSTPATIEVLPEIVKAVGHRTIVMMDGGIRQGTDVFKALALGAKLVFIGRPAIWGLAVNGQQGVEDVLSILRNELSIAMTLSGCRNLEEITPDLVAHENEFCKL